MLPTIVPQSGVADHYLSYVRSLLVIRSANNAVAVSLPALASVLAFVVYSVTGHSLDPANIFASLTLFQLLRMPLMFLRKLLVASATLDSFVLTSLTAVALSTSADAYNATQRLYGVFEAETIAETKVQDTEMKYAVEVIDAEFVWDGPPPEEVKKSKKEKKAAKKSRPATPTEPQSQESTFKLKNVNVAIPHGQLVAIVGPVGSGKSSLLEGMIGEMRRTAGTVRFNGTVAYCPQSAWIQNATVRENITFGQPFDEERYWKAIHDACLETDLELLPNGDMTEVGERVSPQKLAVINTSIDIMLRVSRSPEDRSSVSTSAAPSTSALIFRSSTTRCPPWTPTSASTSSRMSSLGQQQTRRASSSRTHSISSLRSTTSTPWSTGASASTARIRT